MKIILLERIAKLGQMGDIVSVKDGYARNFLLPQGKAMRANEGNIAEFEEKKTQLEAQNLELRSEADSVKEKLAGKSFVAIRQAGETGQLYGSVSTRDISELVTEGGFSIERKQVYLPLPIKLLGLHTITIQLHPEVECEIIINVARSEEEAERQAAGEDVFAKEEDEFVLETFSEDDMDDEDAIVISEEAEKAAAEETSEA